MTRAELARFQEGEPRAFRSAVERESPRLMHFALRLTQRDVDEAEELVQETWVRAYRERAAYRGEAPLQSWLIAICRSRFLSGVRTEGRRAEIVATVAAGDLTPGSATSGPPLSTPLLRRRLAEVLAELPDRQRDVVLLRLGDGLSTNECAARLGIAGGTVKSALHRALETLRPTLEDLRP